MVDALKKILSILKSCETGLFAPMLERSFSHDYRIFRIDRMF